MAELMSHKDHATREQPGFEHLKMLEAYRSSRSLPGAIEANDLDSLMWKGLPLSMIRTGKFPELLNFSGVEKELMVKVSAIIQKENGKTMMMKQNTINYPLFRERNVRCELLSHGGTSTGAGSDLVEMCEESLVGASRSSGGLSLAVGVDMGLIGDVGGTSVNQIRKTKTEMRLMALRATLLARQLTLLHASKEGTLEVEARKLEMRSEYCSAGKAVETATRVDVAVDVFGMATVQKNLLNVLTSEWPSQRLTHIESGQHDIYSGILVRGDNRFTYITQGVTDENIVNGVTLPPSEFWSEVVHLFKTLGGLEDLIDVVSETRGLAPILIYASRTLKQVLHVGVPYPKVKCYGKLKLDSGGVPFVKTTELETSTLVLLVDNILCSAYIANVHYLSETLGLLSTQLVPDGRYVNDRINDLMSCYELKSRSASGCVNDYLTPWMVRLSRFGRISAMVLKNQVSRYRLGLKEDMMTHVLYIGTDNILTASSYSRLKQSIVIPSNNGGFHSKRENLGDLIKLTNWAKTIGQVEGTPVGGPSIVGYHITEEVDTVLVEFCKFEGSYKAVGYVVGVPYKTQTHSRYSMPDTFFHQSKYMRATSDDNLDGSSVEPKPNSFKIAPSLVTILDPPNKSDFKDSSSEVSTDGMTSDQSSTNPGNIPIPEVMTTHLIEIPAVVEETIKYTPGNCGIESLAHLDSSIDIAAGLALIGCKVEDRAFLQGNELATITIEHGKDLVIHNQTGMIDYYGNRKRPALHLKQVGNHFIPMKVREGASVMARALLMQPKELPRNEEERKRLREYIMRNQPKTGGGGDQILQLRKL